MKFVPIHRLQAIIDILPEGNALCRVRIDIDLEQEKIIEISKGIKRVSTSRCTRRMYPLSFPRLRPSIAGKHVSLRDGKRCRYLERGKKRHVSLIPGWNLSQQSSLFAHPLSVSLCLSYPPSGDIKIFHVLDREGRVGESMVSRPQCVHVARYITRLQRRVSTRDIRQWFNVWIRVGYSIFGKCWAIESRRKRKGFLSAIFFFFYLLFKVVAIGKLRILFLNIRSILIFLSRWTIWFISEIERDNTFW